MAASDPTDDIRGDNIVRWPKVQSRPAHRGAPASEGSAATAARVVSFDRTELRLILNLYGRQVAAGEWRDYAIDFSGDRAEFCIMRRSNEYPVYRIRKVPALAKKQGAFSVVSVTGFIVKRGHDLRNVLAVLEPKAKLQPA